MDALLINLAEQWRHLPARLADHVMITAVALAAGLALSLPLGIYIARRARLRYPVLAVVSVIQTIPSLALLALMVPILLGVGALTSRWLGVEISALGFWPTVIALTLYSMLPIVRNTVAGLLGVDAAVREAATGVGMTPFDSLWRVELPLAAPVILAGIRTATVWVVGIATLSTPVGQRSLGDFIFAGLQTRNWVMVLVGCVSAAVLAVALDAMLGGLERAAAQRRRGLGLASGAALAAVFVAAMSGPALVRAAQTGPAPPSVAVEVDEAHHRDMVVRIGAKTFTEQYILAELIEIVVEEAGFSTQQRAGLGSTVVFDALAGSEIDVYVDYSGTIWANYMRRSGSADPQTVLDDMTWWLARRHGIRCLGGLGFENAYALAMRRNVADEFDIESIADLAAHTPNMTIGGDYEFFSRPEWRDLRDGYDLRFVDHVSYDSTFMYSAVATGEVEVISAFSSDGRIAAFDLVTLDDPQHVTPPYDAVLLLGPAAAGNPVLVQTLRPLVESIPVELMREANYMVDRDEDKRTIRQAARWLHERLNNAADHRE